VSHLDIISSHWVTICIRSSWTKILKKTKFNLLLNPKNWAFL